MTPEVSQLIVQQFVEEYNKATDAQTTAQAAFNDANAALSAANDALNRLNAIRTLIVKFPDIQAALVALNITL